MACGLYMISGNISDMYLYVYICMHIYIWHAYIYIHVYVSIYRASILTLIIFITNNLAVTICNHHDVDAVSLALILTIGGTRRSKQYAPHMSWSSMLASSDLPWGLRILPGQAI